MIAADTSTWIAFLDASRGSDAAVLDQALKDYQIVMIPIVLTELLSDPKLPSHVAQNLLEIPLLELQPGFWQRAGALRATVLAKQRKARLGDALIAQCCLDHSIPLITRDRDFRAFQEAAKIEVLRP